MHVVRGRDDGGTVCVDLARYDSVSFHDVTHSHSCSVYLIVIRAVCEMCNRVYGMGLMYSGSVV